MRLPTTSLRRPSRLARPAAPLAAALALGLNALPAAADDLDNLQSLTQGQFRRLSEDFGAAMSFKPLLPAEPLGVTGFDIGFAVSGTRLRSLETWRQATDDSDFPRYLPLPTFRVHKGLPFDIDIGAAYAAVPDSNIRFLAGELRWAAIEGSAVTPAVALRVAASKLMGVDQLDARTTSVDLSISKGFLMFTPYAGVGHVWTKADPNTANLSSESFSQSKVFGGVNVNFGILNLALEGDRTGGITSYGIKLGWRF